MKALKMFRSAALIAVGVMTTKVAVTLLGLLISISELTKGLADDESVLRFAYVVIIIYCGLGLAPTFAIAFLTYMTAKGRQKWQGLWLVLAFSSLLFGTHLVYANVLHVKNPIPDQFIVGFSWVAEMALLASVILVLVSRSLGAQGIAPKEVAR